ncbi:hypothetical protein BJY01DRAFT_254027 [Aspergillus pseudoustus]|uniref:FAD-binding domain-containing protein n=1 Tax=Aspergillus pseudoustus TaxID=1810923 RepID=A0ABR4IWQ6_9EURO
MPDRSPGTVDGKASKAGSVAEYNEQEASIMFGMHFPASEYEEDITQIKDKRAFMKDQLKSRNWHHGYHQLVDAISSDDIYAVHNRTSKPLPNDWRNNVHDPSKPELGHPRVWLIGDAIHAMLPSRGMGANQALHDCADALLALQGLAGLSESSGKVPDDKVAEFVNQYESKMMPRAFSWVKKSGGVNDRVRKTSSFSAHFTS